jgi:hypothetical protein
MTGMTTVIVAITAGNLGWCITNRSHRGITATAMGSGRSTMSPYRFARGGIIAATSVVTTMTIVIVAIAENIAGIERQLNGHLVTLSSPPCAGFLVFLRVRLKSAT